VRVVAATHRNLETLISEGGFREDLYYRLKGVELELPPLRERRSDIPAFVRLFMDEFCRREGIAAPHIESEAHTLLLRHDYPGNVRELQNLIEGAVALADTTLDAELLKSLMGPTNESQDQETALDLETTLQHHIHRVLRLAGGNKSAAARMLGVDRRTLQRKGF
jgi:transcriptional regulator with PAS, ATPase and Fis domain